MAKISIKIKPNQALPKHRTKVIKGGGSADYQFPTDLVGDALKGLKGKDLRQKPKTDKDGDGLTDDFFGRFGGIWDAIKPVAVQLPDDEDFQALVRGADHIQGLIIQRQFDEVLERFLGEMESIASMAKSRMSARFQPAIADHQRQVARLRAELEKALPKLVQELAKRNPNVPVPVLIGHAVQGIAEQLMPILSVLGAYTTAFSQNMDGRFARQLRAVDLYMEHCFLLSQGVDLDAVLAGKSSQPQMGASSFQLGDVLLSAFAGDGLGTIPGTTGPIGVHLLLTPLDMQDWLPQAFPLLGHESRHQFFHDVNGLSDDVREGVIKALKDGHKKGDFKLSSETIKIGRQSFKAIDVISKIVGGDCIGEIDADASAVLQSGPAFHTSMLLSFPALLVREGRVKDAKQLLRPSTVYTIVETDDGNEIEFEVHPPDIMRTELNAGFYDELGMKQPDGAMIRRLSKLCVGDAGEYVSWVDSAGKSSMVVKLPMADVRAISPTVAKALLRTKYPSQGNKSGADLVLWTPARQAKVDRLAKLMLAGKGDLPKDIGSVHATYVGAASAKAFSDALTDHLDAGKSREKINEAAFTMFDQLSEQWEKARK